MIKVDGTGFVRADRWFSIFPELGLYPPLGGSCSSAVILTPCIKTVDALLVRCPALTAQQDMIAPIPVSDAGLRDFLDPRFGGRLQATLALAIVARPLRPKHLTAPPYANRPGARALVDKLTSPLRYHSLFYITSGYMALSRLRSATCLRSLSFSPFSCASRRISDGISPGYFLRQA